MISTFGVTIIVYLIKILSGYQNFSKENIVNFLLTELYNELKDKLVLLHLENIHHLASHRRQTPCLQNLLNLSLANSS